MRLDFITFSITGPNESPTVVGHMVNGVISKATGGGPVTARTRCDKDRFTISNPGGTAPQTVCGTLTGEHMYIDSSIECNDLSVVYGKGQPNPKRSWNILVTQLPCDYANLAPSGCTQYFYGAVGGTIKTFNFDGGLHLADQDQNICIRRESNNCRICYSSKVVTDFQVSGGAATSKVGLIELT